MSRLLSAGLAVAALIAGGLLHAEDVPAADAAGKQQQREFFESRIRPVLIEHCYECHNSAETSEGGLAVDDRRGLRKGGDSGRLLVPGRPEQSRLIAILRHEIDGLEMPQGGPRLDDRVVSDFEQWIAEGAFDPRDAPPTAEELNAVTSWDAVMQRRLKWWSFQPIRDVSVPNVTAGTADSGSGHPVDAFILQKLRENGLEPAPAAEPAVLVRRLFFRLTGLPPDAEQAIAWSERLTQAGSTGRQQVVTQLVDELLADSGFGERWARHWMDWIRYAESHGSEGDPEIPDAWRYRDYLIRALNADVPVDRLLREHVAGDLLPEPRRNPELGINEAAIGPAHWRMVFHGFAPTDALDEKVRFIDDQVNSFSKAFLGLTVSCARCHNHKFDAISQQDYYALFGILASCRPGRTVIDLPERTNLHLDELAELKQQIREAVARDWQNAAAARQRRLTGGEDSWQSADQKGLATVLLPLVEMHRAVADGQDFETAWKERLGQWSQQRRTGDVWRSDPETRKFWSLAEPSDRERWYASGTGRWPQGARAGDFAVQPEGPRALTGIYPAGVYSHSLSSKHAARLASPDVTLSEELELWVRVIGDGGATVRYVVQDYPRRGTVYPVTELKNEWTWQRFDLTYWTGDGIHIELTAAADAPLLVRNQPRSWFGVREAVLRPKGTMPPPGGAEFLTLIVEAAERAGVSSVKELAAVYSDVIDAAVRSWQADAATDAQALLLDACLRSGLLPGELEALPTARPLIERYRRREADVPVPTRVPGLDESTGRDHPLFQRGDHRKPGPMVPRRFLEAIDATPYSTAQSGRRELAEDLLRPDNPLTRRVLVNRVWHHLFGRGIVATPDNFGRLGELPSHPELLDWLALRFERDGWSLKRLIRLIVTSSTWQRSSRPSPEARERDPQNRLLAHARVTRLEAEAIRDLLLAVSGKLDRRSGGPPVAGSTPRRSVYVRVRRNALDPFLRAFDFPEPTASVGRRDVTNVPAQSLMFLNDARVTGYAADWARRALALPLQGDADSVERERIQYLFQTGLGRSATDTETDQARRYLESTRSRLAEQRRLVETQRRRIAERRREIEAIRTPVRRRLLDQTRMPPGEAGQGDAGQKDAGERSPVPAPIGQWDFESGVVDRIGDADGELRNGAVIADGTLVLDGRGHVVTRRLNRALREKTLEAWVQLDSLDQRGGGVMTVQTPDGVFFDSIVFGERDPGQWLAGSNNFARTQPFGGPREDEAVSEPVHVAITYAADGTVRGYRNGRPYGKSYRSDGPYEFHAGEAVVSFGVRHLPAGGNRLLRGRILRARLYDRALTAEEIAASSALSGIITDRQVMENLTADQRRAVDRLAEEIRRLETELQHAGPFAERSDETQVWSELARGLFTLKEFIYVR